VKPNKIQVYTLAVQEVLALLKTCTDNKILQSLSFVRHVVPISPQAVDPLADDNLRVCTFQDLLTLQDPYHDYSLLLQTFDALLLKYPESAWGYIIRARLLWGIEYYAAALEDLTRAHTLAPEMILIQRMRAETLFFLSRYEDALSLITIIIGHQPQVSRNYIIRYLILCGLANKITTNKMIYDIYINAAISDLECAIKIAPSKSTKLSPLIRMLKSARQNS
jgi:tetratricopeptide (TPR) repeat protein